MLCIRSKSCKYFLQPILGETAKNSWDISDGMLGWSTYKFFFPKRAGGSAKPPEKHEKPTEVRAQDHISMNGVQLQGNRFPWAITRLTGVEHVQGISTWNQLKLKHAEALNTSQHSREAWSPPINGPTHQKKHQPLELHPSGYYSSSQVRPSESIELTPLGALLSTRMSSKPFKMPWSKAGKSSIIS